MVSKQDESTFPYGRYLAVFVLTYLLLEISVLLVALFIFNLFDAGPIDGFISFSQLFIFIGAFYLTFRFTNKKQRNNIDAGLSAELKIDSDTMNKQITMHNTSDNNHPASTSNTALLMGHVFLLITLASFNFIQNTYVILLLSLPTALLTVGFYSFGLKRSSKKG